MASPIHDVIMLFGDSITQGGWQNGGFGHRLDGQRYHRTKIDVYPPRQMPTPESSTY